MIASRRSLFVIGAAVAALYCGLVGFGALQSFEPGHGRVSIRQSLAADPSEHSQSSAFDSEIEKVAEEQHEEENEVERSLDTPTGRSMALLLSAMLVCISMAFDWVKDKALEHTPEIYLPVIEMLYAELCTMGFISLVMFILSKGMLGPDVISPMEYISLMLLNSKEGMIELAEGVHMVIFFIMVLLIALIVCSLFYVVLIARKWRRWEQLALSDCQTSKLLARVETVQGKLSLNEQCELQRFTSLRKRFCELHRMDPSDFDFGEYLLNVTTHALSRTIAIQPADWLFCGVYFSLCFAIALTHPELRLIVFIGMAYPVFGISLMLKNKLTSIRELLVPAQVDDTPLRPPFFDNAKETKACTAACTSKRKRMNEGCKCLHDTLFWASSRRLTFTLMRSATLATVLYLALFCVRYASLLYEWNIMAPVVSLLPIPFTVYCLDDALKMFALCTSVEAHSKAKTLSLVRLNVKTNKVMAMLRTLANLRVYAAQIGKSASALGSADAEQRAAARAAAEASDSPQLEQYKRMLRELFDAIDTDNSNSIEADEVGTLMKSLGNEMSEDEIQNLVKVMDADGSGEISFEELSTVMVSHYTVMSGNEDPGQVAESLWEVFDADKSGSIDISEVKNVLDRLGANWDLQQVMDFFYEVDTDRSGTIEKEEFVTFVVEHTK